MLVEGLYSYLSANAGLQTALGVPRSDKSSGIWAGLTPDEALMPALAINQVTGMPLQESFQGTGALQTSRWRFSCYGSTYKSAKLVAQALRSALLQMDGPLPAGSVEVHGAWLKMEADEAEAIPHGTIYSTHVDFEIIYLDLMA